MLSDREQRALDELERAYFATAPEQSRPPSTEGQRRAVRPGRALTAVLVVVGSLVVVLFITGAGAGAVPLAAASALGALLWSSWSWLRDAS